MKDGVVADVSERAQKLAFEAGWRLDQPQCLIGMRGEDQPVEAPRLAGGVTDANAGEGMSRARQGLRVLRLCAPRGKISTCRSASTNSGAATGWRAVRLGRATRNRNIREDLRQSRRRTTCCWRASARQGGRTGR